MKTHILLPGFAALLSACASVETPKPTLDQDAQRWVGRPATELIAAKGEPTKTITRKYETGELIEKTLEYSGAAAFGNAAQNNNRLQPVLINGQWVMASDGSVSVGNKPPECKLSFKTDANQVVRSWVAEGKGCRP